MRKDNLKDDSDTRRIEIGEMQTAKIISWATDDVGSSKTFYTFIIGKVFWDTSISLREEMDIKKLCHLLK